MRPLLELFELEKALYELRYELDNRPAWVRMPLQGIPALLGAGQMPLQRRTDEEAAMENVDILIEPVRAFLAQVGAFLPRLALALAACVVGWLARRAHGRGSRSSRGCGRSTSTCSPSARARTIS